MVLHWVADNVVPTGDVLVFLTKRHEYKDGWPPCDKDIYTEYHETVELLRIIWCPKLKQDTDGQADWQTHAAH
jgi:hypothetical protein